MSQAEDVVHGRWCACKAMRTHATTHIQSGNGGDYESHSVTSCSRRVRIDRIGDTSLDLQLEQLRGLTIPVILINGLPYEMRHRTQRMQWRVEPMGKVRMSQSDKWKVGDKARPAVKRYRAYHDALRDLGVTVEPGDEIHFHIQMPQSWSGKKKALHDGTPHRQRPDLDNLVGGLIDGVCPEDKHIDRQGETSKRWTSKPSSVIIIRRT